MKSAVLIAMTILCASAHAEFRVVETDRDTVAVEAAPKTVVERGKRPDKLAPVAAHGSRVPLKDALKAVAPLGWNGYARETDMTVPVSWAAASNWIEVLGKIMEATGNTATVDWDVKRVLVAKAPAKPVAATPLTKSGPRVEWVVKAQSHLRETLREWATEAGWDVWWALPEQDDFRAEAGDTYKGDFKSAVRGLFDSLPAQIRIRAELRPDNVPPLLFVTRDEGVRP